MPSMANITVKKNDGTTDIVYDALSGSAGDGSSAVWRQDTGAVAGLPVGYRASLKLATKNNGPKTARVAEGVYKRPYAYQDSTTSLYSSKDSVLIEIRATLPQGMPSTELNEAVSQGLNLFASVLVKDSLKAGFSPT